MTQTTVEQAMEIALRLHQGGRLAEAEGIYRQVLGQLPDHPDALQRLGRVLHGQGRRDEAIAALGQVVALRPQSAEAHNDLGVACRGAGRWDEAIAAILQAIALRPDYAAAYNNLGNSLRDAGKLDQAIAAFDRAVSLEPGSAEAHNNRGVACHEAGRRDEAIAAFGRAIALRPDYARAHDNLGNSLADSQRLDEALAAHHRAIALWPDFAQAYSNLGKTLRRAGQLDAAIAAHRRAVALAPADASAHNGLVITLRQAGHAELAIAACQPWIALEPGNADAHGVLGITLSEAGWLDEAIAALSRALECAPNSAEAHNNLGAAWHRAGQSDLALACFRMALEHQPDYAPAASNLLLAAHYHPGYDAAMLLAEHCHWAERFATPLAPQIGPHARDRTPDRRLRVGFVSPDFREHPVGRLVRPLLAHRDRGHTEFVAYSDVPVPDGVTHELKFLADGWRNVAGMSDVDLDQQIRDDEVDILVDLALHTAGNRMLVFARKPAPVQVTMLGLPATTGLSTIDYRLTDPYLDPPGLTDLNYSEQSIRLPHCFWIFEPPADSPPVSALPAESNDHVTFGCLNQFAKVSRPTLELWRRILQAVPNARLVIQAQPGRHCTAVHAFFQQGDVAADRVEFAAQAGRPAYFRRFQSLDLGLDPFPFNGHNSTLDALWMGVPVITLAGATAVGRAGVSLLSNLDLTELIAQTPEEYVALAGALASDRARLAELRAGLRGRMQASPLMDGPRFTADVEAALRRMWKAWCSP